jgi:hypothetical protein
MSRALVVLALVVVGATTARPRSIRVGRHRVGLREQARLLQRRDRDRRRYSAQACVDTGGVPRSFAGSSQRGTCSADWMQAEDGGIIYRCYGEASVWCR